MSDSDQFQLFAEEFTVDDQPEMAGLSFGEEPWSRAASEWISESEVLDCIEKYRTRVWIYRDKDDQPVGFSSLEPTGWQKWPPVEGKRSRLLYIRQLGIDSKFRGYPPDRQWRYSSQIMDHLVFVARDLALEIRGEKPPSKHVELLTLRVHNDNVGAQKVYQRAGFELLEDFELNDHLTMLSLIHI